MPKVDHGEDQGKETVKDEEEVHKGLILLIEVVVPDTSDREKVIDYSQE